MSIDPRSRRVLILAGIGLPIAVVAGLILAGIGRHNAAGKVAGGAIKIEGHVLGLQADTSGVWAGYSSGSVVHYDARSAKTPTRYAFALQSLDYGSAPMALADTTLWLVSDRSRLARLDLRTGSTEPGPGGLFDLPSVWVGSGALWVAESGSADEARVRKLDSRTGAPLESPIAIPAVARHASFGDGDAWFVSAIEPGKMALVHIDPETGATTGNYTLTGIGSGSCGISASASVVLVCGTSGTVVQVDPRTGKVMRETSTLEGKPVQMVATGEAVWLVSSVTIDTGGPGTPGFKARRFDPKTGAQVGEPILVDRGNAFAATAKDRDLWVASADPGGVVGSITRIAGR